MPAIPLITGAVSAFASYKQAKGQSKIASAQQGIMGEQSGLAKELTSFARDRMASGQPALDKAMSYYTRLATGNRGMINSALAPDRAALNDTYKGAEMGIDHSIGSGPRRDQAIAELYRKRAGQLGTMPFVAKQGAVNSMAQLGQNQVSAGLTGYGDAANALGAAGQSGQRWSDQNNQANQAWSSLINSGGDLASGAYDWYKTRAKAPGGN